MQKADLNSFFTASGKKEFTRCLIVNTTVCEWSEPAENALSGRSTDRLRIGLAELENSLVDWSIYTLRAIKLKPKKLLRDYYISAIEAVKKGLSQTDRGKMIMAYGTGKTFTSLKIAEELAGTGKLVLFLVPSLSLMSQTIIE